MKRLSCSHTLVITLDVLVTFVSIIFCLIGVLGIAAGDAGLADSTGYSHIVLDMNPFGMGSIPLLGGISVNPTAPTNGGSGRGCNARNFDDYATCSATSDGDCDDGGPGAEYGICTFGSDYSDCGYRVCVNGRALAPAENDRARPFPFISSTVADKMRSFLQRAQTIALSENEKGVAEAKAAEDEEKTEAKQIDRRKLQFGNFDFTITVGMFLTLGGYCFHSEFMGSSEEACDYWQDLDGFGEFCDNLDSLGNTTTGGMSVDAMQKICNHRDIGTGLAVLTILSFIFLIWKFVIGLVRYCTDCCCAGRCNNGCNIFLSCLISLLMLLVAIIYGAECYPEEYFEAIEDSAANSDVDAGYSAGFGCMLAGGLFMFGSGILSAIDCCCEINTPDEPTNVTSGVTMVSSTNPAVVSAADPTPSTKSKKEPKAKKEPEPVKAPVNTGQSFA